MKFGLLIHRVDRRVGDLAIELELIKPSGIQRKIASGVIHAEYTIYCV